MQSTEGKRSCSELWDLYSSMATTGWRIDQPLAEMIAAARALPRQGWADVNLVVSHARRRAVIREVMAERLAAESPAETLTIPKWTDANSQEIVVWPGVVLTAVLDGISRFGIYNAQLLIVQGWSDDALRLRCAHLEQLFRRACRCPPPRGHLGGPGERDGPVVFGGGGDVPLEGQREHLGLRAHEGRGIVVRCEGGRAVDWQS